MRRASRTTMLAALDSSAALRVRPRLSVSPYRRICVSGVRSSWVTATANCWRNRANAAARSARTRIVMSRSSTSSVTSASSCSTRGPMIVATASLMRGSSRTSTTSELSRVMAAARACDRLNDGPAVPRSAPYADVTVTESAESGRCVVLSASGSSERSYFRSFGSTCDATDAADTTNPRKRCVRRAGAGLISNIQGPPALCPATIRAVGSNGGPVRARSNRESTSASTVARCSDPDAISRASPSTANAPIGCGMPVQLQAYIESARCSIDATCCAIGALTSGGTSA